MVKVLVATTEAQGSRPDDLHEAVEGELVYVPPMGCLPPSPDSPENSDPCGPDCACERSFVGMASNGLITTALVVERADLRVDDLWTALSDSLERQGRLGPDSEDDERRFRLAFQRTLVTASHFSTGSVIERAGEHIHRRALTEPLFVPFDLIGGDG